MSLTTENTDDSKSLEDIKYIKQIIKEQKEDFPLSKFYSILSQNKIFNTWNNRTKNIPVVIADKNSYTDEVVNFDASYNAYIRNSILNIDRIQKIKSKLLKFGSIISGKNNSRHFEYLETTLIQSLLNKSITPEDYAQKYQKILFESELLEMYFVLIVILDYIKNDESLETELSSFFKNVYYKLIQYVKRLYNIDSLTADELVYYLRSVINNNELMDKLYTIYFHNFKDSYGYRKLLDKGGRLLI